MVEPPNPEKKLAELLRKQLAVQTFKSADLPETLRERVKKLHLADQQKKQQLLIRQRYRDKHLPAKSGFTSSNARLLPMSRKWRSEEVRPCMKTSNKLNGNNRLALS
ncbi:hypothetical protein [Sinorhizobium meliloti]|uniref:hypothetical protein n=1 Tax=Rhizobium meliloti TaxID=382 RepID=UPI00115FE33D|nr:hypothetical protein [Sinorhizobium meliloti]MDE4589202.1 hypothetical protein [Sinorhizobium meliloti]